MTFYFKPGTTFDRLANFRTGTSNTVSAGSVVYDAGYTYGGENITFSLQTALDIEQSFTDTFTYTSITGTVAASATTASTVVGRDKVSYTMPVTTITGSLNAGTAPIGENITITGTGTYFLSKLPASNTFRTIAGYDVAGNPQYSYYSSTLVISGLPITGTVTVAAQTPVAPDYRLYISGTGTRFLSDLLVTGGDISSGVLNEVQTPVVQENQITPTILIDNIQLNGSYAWTSNSTSITGTGGFLGVTPGATITFLKPLSGRLYQTRWIPSSITTYVVTRTNYTYGSAGIAVPPPETNVEMYGQSNTSYTWVCPAGTTSISIVCIGAGGNGAYSGSQLQGGGGGGLGYYKNYPVTPGSSYTIVVGMPSAANGGDGGDTYFITSTLVKGGGGKGGAGTRAGGTYAGQGGGNGGDGGGAFIDSPGGGGGGGAGGYDANGGAGGTGYDALYAAGSVSGQAPSAGSDGAGGGAGSGGGAQLPTQAVPVGRGGQASPYSVNDFLTTTFTGGVAGAAGAGAATAGKPDFGSGGAGGTGGSGLATDSLGGVGVCYIIYDNHRETDWAGSSLTNVVYTPSTGYYTSNGYGANNANYHYRSRYDIDAPFPIWGFGNSVEGSEQAFRRLYVYSGGVIAFDSGTATNYLTSSYGTWYASNSPANTSNARISVNPLIINQIGFGRLRSVRYQTEGASPNRRFKVYYEASRGASYTTYPASTIYGSFKNQLGNTVTSEFASMDGKFLNQASPIVLSSSIATVNNYWSGTLIGSTASFWTASSTATSGGATNGYWKLATPFPVRWQGTSYTTLYVSHHSRVSFGDWIDLISSSTITADNRRSYLTGEYESYNGPSLSFYRYGEQGDSYINSSTGQYTAVYDNMDPASCQRILYGTTGVAPNRRYHIRYEGDSSLSVSVGNSKYIWELTFFESPGFGLSSSDAQRYGTWTLVDGTKGDLMTKTYYANPTAPDVFNDAILAPRNELRLNWAYRYEGDSWSEQTSETALDSATWNWAYATTYGYSWPDSSVTTLTDYFPIITTSRYTINRYPETWEVTFPENSSQSIQLHVGNMPTVSYRSTAYDVTFVDDAYSSGLYGNPIVEFNLSNVSFAGSSTYQDTPEALNYLNFIPSSRTAPARYSVIPAGSSTSILVQLATSDWPLVNENNSPTYPANSKMSYSWIGTNITSAGVNVTSNVVNTTWLTSTGTYTGSFANAGTETSIARWPQDGYNSTSVNPNPNPTCSSRLVSFTAYSETTRRVGSWWSGYTTYYDYDTSTVTQGTLGDQPTGFYLFSYGSSATTHSRWLMSKTTYGRYHQASVSFYVANPGVAGAMPSTNNLTRKSNVPYINNLGGNPGTGEDLELWYSTSIEPQPPTAGESPSTLGWTKYSTLYAPSGTANDNPTTRTVFTNTGGGGLVTQSSPAFLSSATPRNVTWLIWQKSFTAQTSVLSSRLSEYAISSFKIDAYHLQSTSTSPGGSLNSSVSPRLKLEVTSGVTLRVPSLKNKNSPVWSEYVEYIVAEDPKRRSLGQVYTVLQAVTSTTTSTPNSSYVNSWYNTTSATTNFGTYFAGLQAAPAYIVETRTVASVINDTTITVTAPMSSTAVYGWGGDPATASTTRAFTIDRIYSDTSMTVYAPYGLPLSTIGSITTSSVNRTVTADRRFTIVNIASETSMTVSGGGIYAPFTGKTSTFPQREPGVFTISGHHDGSNLTSDTTWVSVGIPGYDSQGVFYGPEYFATTRAFIGENSSFAIVSAVNDTSLIISGGSIDSNFYDQPMTLKWNAPSSNIVVVGQGTKFLPQTSGTPGGLSGSTTTYELQVASTSDVRLGRIYIGNTSFTVVSIADDNNMIISGGPITEFFSSATVNAYREVLTFAGPRPLTRFGGASWDKTGTIIGVDESLVAQPANVNFNNYRELFHNTSAALSFSTDEEIVNTSVTVNNTQSSVVLLITWIKDFADNAVGESSNTLNVTVSSVGFTLAYDAELQRNFKDVAGGRTLMLRELSYISTSNTLLVSSITASGSATASATLAWTPSNRLRSGTYSRLAAKISDLSSTAITITVNAGAGGWGSTDGDFLNITVIGAN